MPIALLVFFGAISASGSNLATWRAAARSSAVCTFCAAVLYPQALDVIAAAGGAKYPAYETYVQVVRKGKVGNVLLQSIVSNPNENIYVRPRDQIYLTHNPRTFSVLGATQKVARYPFSSEKVTLAEALAEAGGPIDTIGNPSGIYLFRFEPWFIAKDLADPQTIDVQAGDPPQFVPMLYRIDMRDAQGYFLAQAFQMRDKDVVLRKVCSCKSC